MISCLFKIKTILIFLICLAVFIPSTVFAGKGIGSSSYLHHLIQGRSHLKSNNYQNAIDEFKQAISINSDFADAHYFLGISYAESGKYQEAIEAFKQAIRINADFADAHYRLGISYLANNDKGSAMEEHKILKDLNKELANKLFNLMYP